MSQWYYNKDGQAHGPLKIEDMESRIKNGEIGPLDLVFEVGTTEWKALTQVPVLEAFIVKEEPEPEPEPEVHQAGPEGGPPDLPEWVLLKKVKVDGKSQFKQMGPYTKTQILDFIDQGKVLFQDFIWKAGMESWQPVSAVEAFKVPLPSSPPLETAIYQMPGNDGGVKKETHPKAESNDDNELGSLTELVEIEKYQREKTQMVSAEQLRKQWIQDDQAKASPEVTQKKDSGGDLWSLVPPTEEAPKKSKAVDTSEEKNSLFSLKKTKAAPAQKTKAAVEVEAPVDVTVKTQAPPPEKVIPKTIEAQKPPAAKKKRERPKSRDEFDDEMHDPSSGAGVGRFVKIGAALVVFVVATFLLFSTMDSEEGADTVEVAENSEDDAASLEPIEEPPPAAAPESSSPEVVRQLQEKLQAYEAKLKEKERQLEKKREALAAKREKNKKQKEIREKKKRLAEERRAAKKEAQRQVASKKPKAKPKVAAKPKAKPKPEPVAPIIRRSKIGSNGVPSPIGGSFRNRSYYLQRDRKALFYTALDAERLVTDLESSYKDLKRDKPGWKKFYRGWKSRLKSSTPSLIRSFPSSREDYAYPREIAALKDDHGLLEDYGDLHNAKVLGLRVPASPGKNLTQTFSKHRSKAKSLGR